MTLAWYRSWPAAHEYAELQSKGQLRPHVLDTLPRLVMAGQNYATVERWPEDTPGFCLLEWDIAVDPWGRRAFAAEALAEPRRVLVAPYRLADTWCMHKGNDGRGPTPESRPVTPADDETDSFGLGCVYLPRSVLSEFLEQADHLGFTDFTFGRWYHARYGPARLTWRVHPQHLHEYEDGF